MSESLRLPWSGGTVSGAWDRPEGGPRAVLVLAHGAGGDMNDKFLVALGQRMAENGIAVLRFNFPYREAGRGGPGSARQSEEAYRGVTGAARQAGVPLYIGGKSYGGRMASHIVADGFDVDGLVLISYPLHPPGQFDKLRTAHLPAIRVPTLVIRGTSDAFSRDDLFEEAMRTIPTAEVVQIEGGDHSLRARGRKPDEVIATVVDAIDGFIRRR